MNCKTKTETRSRDFHRERKQNRISNTFLTTVNCFKAKFPNEDKHLRKLSSFAFVAPSSDLKRMIQNLVLSFRTVCNQSILDTTTVTSAS